MPRSADISKKALSVSNGFISTGPQDRLHRFYTDLEVKAHPPGSALERKKLMIALLEKQTQKITRQDTDGQAVEIYAKLLILGPHNEVDRARLEARLRVARYGGRSKEVKERIQHTA